MLRGLGSDCATKLEWHCRVHQLETSLSKRLGYYENREKGLRFSTMPPVGALHHHLKEAIILSHKMKLLNMLPGQPVKTSRLCSL